MAAMTPDNALDAQVMLATTLHAQPGVYALLLGSGVSTGAGIPTGWGVVRDLVRRAAVAHEPVDGEVLRSATQDPEAWWAEHGDGQPLGYSNLLASMAPTPAARRALLAGFFEPTEDDLEAGIKVPSPAHHAVADLVRRGSVRVILTTNFDRLTERALEDAGVSPQVISSVGALAGMSPLQHAPATIIKLHGDYADLLQRNTVEELGAYPPEWDALLDRVLSEYGLLISGWSAGWDHALVAALERLPVRRYPLFWDARSAKGETAQRLLAQQQGTVLSAADADDLFTGLAERLEALDRLAEPPLTTALALQRLKRFLPDDRRRIDLHDLVMGETETVIDYVANQPLTGGLTDQTLDDLIDGYHAAVEPLIRLAAAGVQHDDDERFGGLWVEALQRLLDARGTWSRSEAGREERRHLPALFFLRSVGAAAIRFGHERVLTDLFGATTWQSQFNDQPRPGVYVLNEYQVLTEGEVNQLPRWNGGRWQYPPSHLLRALLRDSWADLVDNDQQYRGLADAYEYRVALFERLNHRYPVPGEFIGERSGLTMDGSLICEAPFLASAERARTWPWDEIAGGRENLTAQMETLREELKQMRRWG